MASDVVCVWCVVVAREVVKRFGSGGLLLLLCVNPAASSSTL